MDGEEGKFIMVTFWLIEAMSRVGFNCLMNIVALAQKRIKLIMG